MSKDFSVNAAISAIKENTTTDEDLDKIRDQGVRRDLMIEGDCRKMKYSTVKPLSIRELI